MLRFVSIIVLAISAPSALALPVSAQTAHMEAVEREADRVRLFQQALAKGKVNGSPQAAQGDLVPMTVYQPRLSQTDHLVVAEDTLFSLSKRYGVSLDTLRSANDLNSDAISLGQILIIPQTSQSVERVETQSSSREATYVVVAKDTLFTVSRKTCVPVPELVERNGLKSPDQLALGQTLSIPAENCLNAPQ